MREVMLQLKMFVYESRNTTDIKVRDWDCCPCVCISDGGDFHHLCGAPTLYLPVFMFQVVVIFIICVVSLLFIYMCFLLCLDPLITKRPRTQYQQQINEEVNLVIFGRWALSHLFIHSLFFSCHACSLFI